MVASMMSDKLVWTPVSIGIGSNLDDPSAQVKAAIASLKSADNIRVTAVSSLYRSAPMGPPDQPDYINAVSIALTKLSPQELLTRLQGIENAQGRKRVPGDQWGPRRIDLDLLTYGWQQVSDSDLLIPHPGISERNFVLLPWAEIAPCYRVPGLGSVDELARAIESNESPTTIID